MGSQSDWATMRRAAETLDELGVGYERASSRPTARPTGSSPSPRARGRAGFKVIIAGAGGAAHLPGMTAALTHAAGARRAGRDQGALGAWISLLSIVQMPAGVPVGTLAIGEAGRGQRRRCSPPRSWRCPTTALAERLDGLARRADGRRSPSAPTDEAPGRMILAPRRDDRHPGRRPARPHAGDGGARSSACARHIFAPEAEAPAYDAAAARTIAALRRRGGAGALRRRRSTSSPSSSRTCRPQTVEFLGDARAGAPGRAGARRRPRTG